MKDGFAHLPDERLCDGYGACTSECEPGALKIEVREAEEFDPDATKKNREEKGIMRPDEEEERVNWPLKMSMVSPEATFFKNANIYIVSDCVPFAMKDFHGMIIKEKGSLLVSCPKFDKIESYRDKLTKIIENANPESLTVVHMEIPCCQDIYGFVESVIKDTGKNTPLNRVIIGTTGAVKLTH
jgi:ferredoxin